MVYTPKKKKKNNLHKVVLVLTGFFLFVVTVLFALFVFLMNQSFVRMHEITIEGVTSIGNERLAAEIVDSLSTQGAWGIPGDNFFLVNTKKLEQSMKDRYSVIQDISIHKKSFTALDVTVEERTGVFLYCESDSDICNPIDNEGVIFKLEGPSATTTPAVVTFYSADSKKVGQNFLDPDQFKALTTLIGSLTPRDVIIANVWSSHENVVTLQSTEGTKFVVKKSVNYDDVYTNIVHLQSLDEFSQMSLIDYINLRFGNKIFYCLRGAVCADNY